jgi:hypothetical protein
VASKGCSQSVSLTINPVAFTSFQSVALNPFHSIALLVSALALCLYLSVFHIMTVAQSIFQFFRTDNPSTQRAFRSIQSFRRAECRTTVVLMSEHAPLKWKARPCMCVQWHQHSYSDTTFKLCSCVQLLCTLTMHSVLDGDAHSSHTFLRK